MTQQFALETPVDKVTMALTAVTALAQCSGRVLGAQLSWAPDRMSRAKHPGKPRRGLAWIKCPRLSRSSEAGAGRAAKPPRAQKLLSG